jgi:hypothetical protein
MLSRLDLTEEVTVLVGSSEKRFMIHKDALVRHSTFFRAAINGGFREAKENLIRLPEINPKEFAIFAHWAYSNELIVMEPQDTGNDKFGRYQRLRLIRAYILADRLGIVRLQNQSMDNYIESMENFHRTPNRINIASVYEQLPERSPMRQLMLDYCVSYKKASWMKENAKYLPEEFTRDCLVAFAEAVEIGKRPERPRDRDKCTYHAHNEEVPKCS